MNHKPWTITAKAGGEIEILLYEMIGLDFWTGEGTTAKQFAEDLKAAGSVSKIHLRVNSPGGNVFDGIAIYNTLLSHGAKVTAQVDGIAASIASVIIMAASEISMGDNAMMMIHNPSTMVAGDSKVMRKMAETMDKVKTSMVTAYKRHTPLSIDKINQLCDDETWMTADEAVENGFAETVTTPEGDAADVAANFDLSKFRRVPQEIAARFGATTPGGAPQRMQPPNPRAAVSHTKRVDGENLTSECFIYVGDEEKTDTWHLPWRFSSEEKTVSHLRDALARFDQTEIPDSEKPAARAKLVRLAKEHGIKVSDDKSGKALLHLMADAMMCACDCEACMTDNCTACKDGDCEDVNCKGCPMQAKASADSRVALTGDLVDARRAHESANVRVVLLETQIAQMDRDAKAAAKAAAETSSKWMARISQQFGESTKLYAKSATDLQIRADKAEKALARVRARIGAAESLLTGLKAQRAAEAATFTQWTERLSGELRKSSTLYASAITEIGTRATTQSDLGKRLASLESILAAAKAGRAVDLKALVAWTDRVNRELGQSAELNASALKEVAMRAQMQKDIRAKVEAVEAILTQAKTERSAELKALITWAGRVNGELRQSAELNASALKEVATRAQMQKDIRAQVGRVEAILAQIKTERAAELKGLAAWTDRVIGELRESAKLNAAALKEVGERGRLQGDIRAQVEGIGKVLSDLKAERSSELKALMAWTDRVTGELRESAKLHASAADEISRRSRVAETSSEIGSQITAAENLLAEFNTDRATEVAALTESLARLDGELKKVGELHDSAVDEISRRSRLAETSAEMGSQITVAETMLAELKTGHASELAAETESEARLNEGLKKAGELLASAADEISRRSRVAGQTAESAGAGGIENAEDLLGQLKNECAAELAAETESGARLAGDLKKAGELQASAAAEVVRRSRVAGHVESDGADVIAASEAIATKVKVELEAEVAASTASNERILAALEEAAKLQTSAADEFTRRSRHAETSSGQLGESISAAEALIAELKTEAALPDTTDAAAPDVCTANQKRAGEISKAALEEIERRARLTALNA